MTNEQLNFELVSLSKYVPASSIFALREALSKLNESQAIVLRTLDLKDPTTILIASLLGGGLGIDRFLIGDTTTGVLKLITAGGCGIWAIIDLFFIQEATRKKNLEVILTQLAQLGV